MHGDLRGVLDRLLVVGGILGGEERQAAERDMPARRYGARHVELPQVAVQVPGIDEVDDVVAVDVDREGRAKGRRRAARTVAGIDLDVVGTCSPHSVRAALQEDDEERAVTVEAGPA